MSLDACCSQRNTHAYDGESTSVPWTRHWLRIVIPASAVALAAVLNIYFLLNAYVPSASMEPTIPSGAMILGNRLAYSENGPKAGDIVFFHHAEAGDDQWLVKRVVAVPGQTFAVTDGHVYIDGKLLCEYYVDTFSSDDYPAVLVPENCYIVLGDNRRESKDSRFWDDPFVRREDIGAKGMFVYFPGFCNL